MKKIPKTKNALVSPAKTGEEREKRLAKGPHGRHETDIRTRTGTTLGSCRQGLTSSAQAWGLAHRSTGSELGRAEAWEGRGEEA